MDEPSSVVQKQDDNSGWGSVQDGVSGDGNAAAAAAAPFILGAPPGWGDDGTDEPSTAAREPFADAGAAAAGEKLDVGGSSITGSTMVSIVQPESCTASESSEGAHTFRSSEQDVVSIIS
eukprot:Hpha_TRINITY_DN23841_c0_g1::TRINITY_DN23841_c0_g1_i1::g.109856::m.109856